MMRRNIVTLCGSTRFREEFERANREETLKGNIVLSVGHYPHETGTRPEVKAELDRLHKDKISMSDEILVLNPGRYIGDSTRSEIQHAINENKTVRYLTPLSKMDKIILAYGMNPALTSPQEVPVDNVLPFDDIEMMHTAFWGEDVRAKVGAMSQKMKKQLYLFRWRFIMEEVTEIERAETAEDFVDGLIDTMVVIIGTLHLFNVDGKKAWKEVLRANMMKETGIKESRPNPFGFPDLIKPPGWVGPDHRGNVGVLSEVFGSTNTEDKPCDTTGTTDCTRNPSAGCGANVEDAGAR